jgi:hypothetical protein
MSEATFRLGMYAVGFVLGFVLMGFEMLGSRYLNPYFGSGIYTWAALISVTLFALMIGYFLGGWMVDRRPTAGVLGTLVLLAAAWMALIPFAVDPGNAAAYLGLQTPDMLLAVGEAFGYGPAGIALGVTTAAFLLIFVPLTLIACFSPFAVRLLLVATHTSGRQTGTVYGISTSGNIIGTLATTFVLIPSIGSTAITWVFAAITAAMALVLMAMGRAMGQPTGRGARAT